MGELRENPFKGHHVWDRTRTIDVELSQFVWLLMDPVVKNQILQDIEEAQVKEAERKHNEKAINDAEIRRAMHPVQSRYPYNKSPYGRA